MKVKITIEEIRKYLDIETPEFPKYVAPLINLANRGVVDTSLIL